MRRWLKGNSGGYIQATEGTSVSQRAAFASDLEAILPGFAAVVYPTWRALFDSMQRSWTGGALVVDEFPYLVASSPELPSVLQARLDAPEVDPG